MNRSRSRRIGTLLMVGACLCWSTGGLIVRHLTTADQWEIAFWRAAFMLVGLGGYLLAIHRTGIVGRVTAMGWPGLASSLMWSAAMILFILALTHTTVANTLVIMSVSPFVAGVLGRAVLGERLGPRSWAAMAVGFGGIALMFADSLGRGGSLGNLYALGVALALATNIVVQRSAHAAVDLMPAAFVAGLICVALSAPLAWPLDTAPADLAWLAAMGVFQLALGCVLFTLAVPRLSAGEVGLLSLLEVVLGPIWVWMRFGERPADLALVGGAIAVLALAANELAKLRDEDRTRFASRDAAS